MTEIRGRKSEAGAARLEVGGGAFGSQRLEDRGQKTEDGGQKVRK